MEPDKDADAEIEAPVLGGQVDAEIHRTEITVKTVFPHFVETGARVDQENPLIHVHSSSPDIS